MRKILLFTVLLLLSTLACTITIGEPKEPTEFVQFVYVYEPNSDGGTDIAFLVERNRDYSAAFTFLDQDLSVDYILRLQSSDPYEGLDAFVTDKEGNNPVSGISDSMGHIKISVPYLGGKLNINGGWTCDAVAEWHGATKENVVLNGGALWRCKR